MSPISCYPHTRAFCSFAAVLAFAIGGAAAEPAFASETEGAQKERLRQQIRAMIETNRVEMAKRGMTNANGELPLPAADDAAVDALYRMLVVHPAFGLGWDEVPAPNLKGVEAMKGVNSFVATNGWNMWTNEVLLFALPHSGERPLTGLPWKEIRDRPFPALTLGGILFVPWSGFGTECSGVAWNPNTNKFPSTINKFKPIGDHWYVWTQTQSPAGVQQYEGRKQ